MNCQTNTFESLFIEYKNYIKALIYKFNSQYGSIMKFEDIQELEQDCWLKVFETMGNSTTIIHPKSYLFILVRNSFIDHSKKISRNDYSSIDQFNELIIFTDGSINAEYEPENIINKINNEHYIALMKEIIKELPLKKQLIFKMRYLDNNTQEDTAKVLKISQSTVSEHETYVLKYLKDELTKELGSYN
jgi:RNA polymerase sigma factor (sigma-70 family)